MTSNRLTVEKKGGGQTLVEGSNKGGVEIKDRNEEKKIEGEREKRKGKDNIVSHKSVY